MKRLRPRRPPLLAIGALMVMGASACAASSVEDGPRGAAEAFSDTPRTLSDEDHRELSGAGFSVEEIDAVEQSIAISKVLGVQSFVQEANEIAKITIPFGQHRGGLADCKANDAECERMAFEPFNTTAASRPVGKTNFTRKFVYAALSQFRRVEMPQIYARWQRDHNDASIPATYRDELEKIKDPSALATKIKETSQPKVDEGFRRLGIVR